MAKQSCKSRAQNVPREGGGVCVLEIVRPGMEESESAEKQENTGIGPASACRGVVLILRSAHAEDVPQTCRRVRASRRMRTDTAWPPCFETHRSALRLWKRLRSRPAAMLLSMRARGRRVVPAKAGTHDHCRWLWVRALAVLGRDDDRSARVKHQPAAARNARRRNFIVSGCY